MSKLMIVEDTYYNGVSVRLPVHLQTWETTGEMEAKCDALNEQPDAQYKGCFELVEIG